ncbi:MAG: hypothetical protein FWC79_01575 [Oscillospiraceae bacterium]|nr:hypothetical protein [Oscillospiraceae bacterium]
MLKENREFCNEHGIKVVGRKRFEPAWIYSWRTRKQDDEISSLRGKYSKLQELVEKYKKYHQEAAEVVAKFGQPFMVMPDFSVDFSNLNLAKKRIKELCVRLNFPDNEGFHLICQNAKTKAEKAARKQFFELAIEEMPKDKSVVVLLSTYNPRKANQEGFWGRVEELKQQPSKEVYGIRCCLWFEWVTFCPAHHTEESFEEILNTWVTSPLGVEVLYK